jgi:outer membrane protein OmpA-like peptidoglycan-associated protein
MRKTINLLLFLMLLGVSTISAQSYSGSFAFRYVAPNYQWPLENVETLNFDDFGKGLEFEYYHPLSSLLDLSFPLRLNSTMLPKNDTGTDVKNSFNFALNGMLNLNLTQGRTLQPYLFAGLGADIERTEDETLTLDVPVGVGLNIHLGSSTYLSTKASYHIAGADFRDHLNLGVGFRVNLGPGDDLDGDGIKDDEDACPSIPGLESLKGCPDRDGDGVADKDDVCPDVAGPANLQGCPDGDGDGLADKDDACPEAAGPANLMGCPDRDGDGIADKDDGCPDEAGPANNNGCPITDRDGDGIDDEQDKCPDIAGVAATAGCPDRDGDGIADAEDDCPNQPGTAANGGCPDTDGDGIVDRLDACPNLPGLAVNKGCPEIEETDRQVLTEEVDGIEFETGSSVIRTRSYPILDKVADILKRYPGYKVRIGGHTDSVGSSATNQALSEKRAEACYNYLLNKGIPAARMSHAGYGEEQPIADNRNAAGREKNRRVEFDVYIE